MKWSWLKRDSTSTYRVPAAGTNCLGFEKQLSHCEKDPNAMGCMNKKFKIESCGENEEDEEK